MIEIKHRFTGAVLFKSETAETVRQALIEAISAGANLAGAYLARADLAGANLARADLAGANLAGAYLADADLAGADLAGAYLAGADLARADLAGAYLADAYLARAYLARADLAGAYLARADLAGAYLAGAYLADADLAGAYLARADLAGAYLAGAENLPPSVEETAPKEPYERKPIAHDYASRARRYREHHPDVPVVEGLDQKILQVVESGAGKLDMRDWHTCETTHCRAGWAVHFAGKPGYELEKEYGSERAGAMIYRASTGRVPYFFDTNERALADIKRCAAEPGPL